jgi:dolichyl-phosphate-mannose--protein O-mannosyl transferase
VQTTTKELTQTYFMLVKTTNAWLQIPVKERFEFKANIITPILQKYPAVKMRFFDSEAFSGHVTDVLMWETSNVMEYQFLIDELRETLFWGTYFEVVEIIPAIEDAHLLSYPEEARG